MATDGTSANNGYGVYLITPTWATQCSWSDSNTVPESYINSNVKYDISRDVYADEYRTVIGDHLVKRNVLLSSSVDSSGHPNGYTWTQEYITCPTMHNMTGDSNIDDGELNFQLPLCKSSEGINRLAQDLNYYYWTRNIYGIDTTDNYFKAWQYQVKYDYDSAYYYFNSYKRQADPSGVGTASVAVLQMIMIR